MSTKNKALATTTQTAVATQQATAVIEYGNKSANLAQALATEMDGLNLTFERIKIPAGGGLAYEVPSDNPDSPDMVKDFKAVILYHHPSHSYYKERYTGGNTPPDCASNDGHTGIVAETGEIRECKDCPNNKFGSGENGAKLCKQKRRVYILRAGEALPIIFSIPTGSLADFSKYIGRLLNKGKKSNSVVTNFALKKAQNAGGITYSQAVLSVDRVLTADELQIIEPFAEQIKALAQRTTTTDTADYDE